MRLNPEELTKALSDSTRLRIINLLLSFDELCVCEFTYTLELEQPKISRHLAVLRKADIVADRRAGQWIHYRIHPELPYWALKTLTALQMGAHGKKPYAADIHRLNTTNREELRRPC